MLSLQRTLNKKLSGMSLLELMVAIAIGSLLLGGLATVFQRSSTSQRELEKSSDLIENGRYALSLLSEDIRHAGFYGHFHDASSLGTLTAEPDPCELTAAELEVDLIMPIQGYRAANLTTAPDITPTNTCEGSLLTGVNLQDGSDLLVIRRGNSEVFTGTPTNGAIYLHANIRELQLLAGNNGASVPTDSPDNGTPLLKYPSKTGNTTPADSRLHEVHIYFISPCTIGSDTNGVCQDGDEEIPTLKRLELSDDGSGNAVMSIVPLVEGIEFMKVEYGIDTSPTDVDPLTGLDGDGIPDAYVAAPTFSTDPDVNQWPRVVSVRVYLLARTLKATDDHTDTKAYVLGSPANVINVAATGDNFKRHVYSTEVRPVNIASRRERP